MHVAWHGLGAAGDGARQDRVATVMLADRGTIVMQTTTVSFLSRDWGVYPTFCTPRWLRPSATRTPRSSSPGSERCTACRRPWSTGRRRRHSARSSRRRRSLESSTSTTRCDRTERRPYPEHLIAQLGRRYTACDQPGTDLAASTHVPDPMPILLAFFEELKARRQDDLGNTVASALRSRPDTRGRCAKRPQLAATGCSPPRAARVLSSSRRSEEGCRRGRQHTIGSRTRCASSLSRSRRANRRSRGWCSMRWRGSVDSTRSTRRPTDVQSFSLRRSTPTTPTSSPPPSA